MAHKKGKDRDPYGELTGPSVVDEIPLPPKKPSRKRKNNTQQKPSTLRGRGPEGMVTQKRAQQQFVNRFRKLNESLTEAEKEHKRKPDSASEKRIENIEDKISNAKADYFDSSGNWTGDMPRWIQNFIEAPTSLKGTKPRKRGGKVARKSGGKVSRKRGGKVVSKRGGGMVGRNGIIKGYKKGGQV